MIKNSVLKKFIQDNISLIEEGDIASLYHNIALNDFNFEIISGVTQILLNSGIATQEQITNYILEAIAKNISDEIERNLHTFKEIRLLDDPSEGWSRLSQMLQTIETYNVGEDKIINYLLQNKKRLGFVMKELDPKYNYIGFVTDYDVAGYFDEKAYDKMLKDSGEYDG